MSERAVILAGGKGTRLRPYTLVLPKPLMPVGEYPILEIIVRQLARFGFGHITLAVNQQVEIIKAFFGDGAKWGVHIDYSLETRPLSTIAPLCLIEDLPENFLLLNGDVLTDLDLGRFYRHHVEGKRLFSVGAARRKHTVEFGVLYTDASHKLTDFCEKPCMEYLVSMGIYAVNKTVLQLIPPDQPYGFDDLMHGLLARGDRIDVEPHDGYFMDIGRPDDYMRAVEEFEQLKPRLLPCA